MRLGPSAYCNPPGTAEHGIAPHPSPRIQMRNPAKLGALIALLLPLAVTVPAQNRIVELPRAHLPGGISGEVAHFFDFDRDGDLDVIVGSPKGDQLWRQDALYRFQSLTANLPASPRGQSTRAIASGDVDGDGNLDLVLGGPQTTRLWLGDGRGGFVDATATSMPVDSYETYALELADLNGDRQLDLIFANAVYPGGAQNAIYLNNGAGGFRDVTGTNAPALLDRSYAIHVVDIDGDQDPDIVFRVAGLSATAELWLNGGTGVFARGSTRFPTGSPQANDLTVADIDGDMDQDIFFAGPQAYAYINNGQAQFSLLSGAPFAQGDNAFRDPHFVDLHRNGQLYMVGAAGVKSFAVWRWNGSTFEELQQHIPVSYPSRDLQLIDLEGDGDLDICSFWHKGGISLLLNSGTSSGVHSGSWIALNPPREQEIPDDLPIQDFTGDGHADYLQLPNGAAYTQHEGVLAGDGRGLFEPWGPILLQPDPGFIRISKLGDVDGDGHDDILTYAYPPYSQDVQLHLLLRLGNRVWKDVTATHLPPILATRLEVEFVDLDSDQDLDLVLFSYDGFTWKTICLRNDGSGHFSSMPSNLPAPVGHWGSILFHELDGDGKPDAIFADTTGTRLLLSQGNGQFRDVSSTHLHPQMLAEYVAAVGDLDGDGDLDLLLGDATTAPYPVVNDGKAHFSFAPSHQLIVPGYLNSLHCGDIDLDGDLDLFAGISLPAGGRVDPEVRIYENQGGLRFMDVTANWTKKERQYLAGVRLLDLDSDGDLDLVVDGRVRWNLLRHVHTPYVAQLGQPWTIDFAYHGHALQGSATAIPLLGFAHAAIPLPGIGVLGIAPSTMLVGTATPIPAPAGRTQIQIPLPVDPALAGGQLLIQALYLHQPPTGPSRLTLSSTLTEILRH
jgi:hypothetical protein